MTTQGTSESIPRLFSQGNFAEVALKGYPNHWETFAALGLVGKSRAAIEGLNRFDHDDARFYSAVASWIDGDEATAARGLRNIPNDHARRLLGLIRKPRIQVLAQLDRGSQWDFLAAIQSDPKFVVDNFGFRFPDKPNRPYADVGRFLDPSAPPDFYICKLVEWHLVPPNLQSLNCPIFGHTADYDLHIQTVHPWLQLFDELIVTDQTEWRDVTQLCSASVSTFPKAFGLNGGLPPVPADPRKIDVFVSGTALHPYHPDKALLLHQILSLTDLEVGFVNGSLASKLISTFWARRASVSLTSDTPEPCPPAGWKRLPWVRLSLCNTIASSGSMSARMRGSFLTT
jgi:hypothetical protein